MIFSRDTPEISETLKGKKVVDIQVEKLFSEGTWLYDQRGYSGNESLILGRNRDTAANQRLTERNGSLRLNILMAGAVIVARLWRNLQRIILSH